MEKAGNEEGVIISKGEVEGFSEIETAVELEPEVKRVEKGIKEVKSSSSWNDEVQTKGRGKSLKVLL